MDISELLLFSHGQGASDLHISSGEPPMLRINGDMQKVDMPSLSKEEVHSLLYDILNDQQRKVFEESHEIDFSIALKEIARFRVNAFVQARGESAVFRTIPTKIMTFEELGLPKTLADIARAEKGLVLVTGPTGSGKSTTLAAMIDLINNEFKGHIITIEDPIEFVHKSKECLISQRELGPHTHSFSNALRASLREDPDIILVGEMRDLETIQLALTAAETGHLVFGTLHTSSAPKTVDRVIDVFPPEQQEQIRAMFSESIQAVVTQTLIKRRDGKGRVAAIEIMMGTPAIRNLIREAKISQIPSIIQTSQKFGMQTMDQAIKDLVQKNIVAKNEVLQLVSSPSVLG
ncbi:MAG: twitching motility protein PilT [Candidatus Schekmanbacteria bacterium RIFCSPHIGHO2_02_FULL_38_11]|uniref:Twitching motility protein PilT n=1 Tax=Candidatus Schekmanbacteria bacterium RIFCSPLOWO2_12_FULL_38_15 TaxID=1817883 RepID=A0A1F7SHR4_9BACT|nr:MAG: twitching motility protein PilT [Candidatus Schekmanbacteria bacterium GWA2_38_9]OGL51336.1 MAG: twitching motility protein PilT [Candidatus Schekmanbacteria bacterium RIFCSPLOWO2_02_FULL_38_14]OGL53299.1 MAG: twitching motility protein PilT [Candidatus Schekmanbacteria bacterium RIFCSPLOWO2_12_FULL_38_15]OGL55658.1 MAG: twitching motility protein PilT [Candidatus Schekmanbacteria bacterium RIFCSPHIGHO2_02_FULL_38_11]